MLRSSIRSAHIPQELITTIYTTTGIAGHLKLQKGHIVRITVTITETQTAAAAVHSATALRRFSLTRIVTIITIAVILLRVIGQAGPILHLQATRLPAVVEEAAVVEVQAEAAAVAQADP